MSSGRNRSFSFNTVVERGIAWLPYLVPVAMIFVFAARVNIIPRHVHNIGFSESNVIDGIIRLVQGLPLYGDPEQPPFDIIQYGPVMFHACAPVARLFGWGVDDPHRLFMLSRAFCLLCNVLAAVVNWRIGRVLGLPTWCRWLLIGLMATWMHEPYFSRPDSVYQLCCACLVYAALRTTMRHDARWRDAWMMGLWAMLAVFSKQSGVGPVAGVGIGLLVARGWPVAWRYALAALACNVAALAVCSATDGLDNMYANLVQGNVNGYKFPWWCLDPREPYMGMGLWVTPVALWLGYRMRKAGPVFRFLLPAMVVTYAWAFATAGKVGANMNYFMEHYLLAAITCMLVLYSTGVRLSLTRSVLFTALCAVLFLRASWFTKVFLFSGYPADEYAWYEEDLLARQALQEHGLRPNGGVVILGLQTFLDQQLGSQAWLKMKDIVEQSAERLPLDHSALFDEARNQDLRFVITVDTSYFIGPGMDRFPDWSPAFTTGRYTVHERTRR